MIDDTKLRRALIAALFLNPILLLSLYWSSERVVSSKALSFKGTLSLYADSLQILQNKADKREHELRLVLDTLSQMVNEYEKKSAGFITLTSDHLQFQHGILTLLNDLPSSGGFKAKSSQLRDDVKEKIAPLDSIPDPFSPHQENLSQGYDTTAINYLETQILMLKKIETILEKRGRYLIELERVRKRIKELEELK